VSSVVNYQYLNDSDLVFIVISPNQHIFDFINKIKLTSAILCLSAVLLGLLLSYILSLNFYTPVRNLYKNVKEFLAFNEPSSSGADKKNEFEFISNTISHMSGKMNTLEFFKSSSIDIVKERYLSSLLSGSPDSLETIKEKFVQYNVQINPDNRFILIVFKIDGYSDFINKYDQTQQSEIRQQFNRIVCESLSGVSSFDCINLDSDQTVVLANTKEPGLRKNTIVNLVREIQKTMYEKNSLSVSAAISDSSANISDVKTIYVKTLNLLQYRLVYGYACVLTSELLNEVKIDNIIFHTNLVKSLVDSIKNESRDNVRKYHDEFFAYLTPYSPEDIRYGLSYLSVNVFDVLHVIENNSTTIFNVSFMDFNNRINSLETLQEISQCFLSLYEQIIIKIEENRESKSDMIINTVKKYITSSYTDRNLSLTSVAEALNMNPVYLGKQFKNINFKSISEYINEVRIAKAVELMQGSSYTIDEILEKVGWESKKYFFTLFKKYHGVTPNEYRLSNNIKHISG
jgi:AraC-like DNA-binding protein